MKYSNASGSGDSATFDCGRICKFVDVGEQPERMNAETNRIKNIPGTDINITDLLR